MPAREELLRKTVTPNWEELVSCIKRQRTPGRVHHIELFLDPEMQTAVCDRFGLLDGLETADPYFAEKRLVKIQRFLGYDYVRCGADPIDIAFHSATVKDTAELGRDGGRGYIDEHSGPVTNWQEFEAFPWPDPDKVTTRSLEWYEKNLPDDMCVIGSGGFAHIMEWLTWLMGYENLCFALYEQRDLVEAISKWLFEFFERITARLLQFDRVKMIWGSDDMGFKTGTMISPSDLREFVLPSHKRIAQMSHDAGRPYLLHACGNLYEIMEDLIEDVRIDAKHSFEDTIESVIDDKKQYGDRLSLLGGIDVDFLCRSDEAAIRGRVRRTLTECMPGGGYCLGTGNSVANYIPLDNYLIMLDEGRRFGG